MVKLSLLLALPAATAGLTSRSVQFCNTANLYGTDHPAWLKDCKALYLDIGSNIGVQVRKFFEPEKYPGAPVLPLFDAAFGKGPSRRQRSEAGEVCVLGMEPNPKHLFRLKALESFYGSKGWKVHFYPAAASNESGKLVFTGRDPKGFEQPEFMGGHVFRESEAGQGAGWSAGDYKKENCVVPAMDFPKFVRELPRGSVQFMKMDIEGAEYDILDRMIPEKLFCQDIVKALNMEAHRQGEGNNLDGIEKRLKAQTCQPPEFFKFDDEWYPKDETNDDRKMMEQRYNRKGFHDDFQHIA